MWPFRKKRTFRFTDENGDVVLETKAKDEDAAWEAWRMHIAMQVFQSGVTMTGKAYIEEIT